MVSQEKKVIYVDIYKSTDFDLIIIKFLISRTCITALEPLADGLNGAFLFFAILSQTPKSTNKLFSTTVSILLL